MTSLDIQADDEPDAAGGAPAAADEPDNLFSLAEIDAAVESAFRPAVVARHPAGKHGTLLLHHADELTAPNEVTRNGTQILRAEPRPSSHADAEQATVIRPLTASGRAHDDASVALDSTATAESVYPARESRQLAKVRKRLRTMSFKTRLAAVFLPFVLLFVLLSGADVPSRTVGPSRLQGRTAEGALGAKSEAWPPAPSGAAPSGEAARTPPAASRSLRSPPSEKAATSSSAAATSNPEQRLAIDLLIGGDYDAAVRAYEALARAHPETGTYAEAARILRKRAR